MANIKQKNLANLLPGAGKKVRYFVVKAKTTNSPEGPLISPDLPVGEGFTVKGFNQAKGVFLIRQEVDAAEEPREKGTGGFMLADDVAGQDVGGNEDNSRLLVRLEKKALNLLEKGRLNTWATARLDTELAAKLVAVNDRQELMEVVCTHFFKHELLIDLLR